MILKVLLAGLPTLHQAKNLLHKWHPHPEFEEPCKKYFHIKI
jgi:hypothetical protein